MWEQTTRIERVLHCDLVSDSGAGKLKVLLDLARSDGERCLDIVDFLLVGMGNEYAEKPRQVAELLDQAGSAWAATYYGRACRLTRRVHEAVTAAMTTASAPKDNASAHLKDAWSFAFRRDPLASSAYYEAVKALEAAYQPIVKPHDTTATLGKIVGEILGAPELFGVRLQNSKGSGTLAIEAALRSIWETQERHGSGIAGAPTSETIEEARDAVIMAVSLVQLVRQGGFWRK